MATTEDPKWPPARTSNWPLTLKIGVDPAAAVTVDVPAGSEYDSCVGSANDLRSIEQYSAAARTIVREIRRITWSPSSLLVTISIVEKRAPTSIAQLFVSRRESVLPHQPRETYRSGSGFLPESSALTAARTGTSLPVRRELSTSRGRYGMSAMPAQPPSKGLAGGPVILAGLDNGAG
jgi:hypothetical protein